MAFSHLAPGLEQLRLSLVDNRIQAASSEATHRRRILIAAPIPPTRSPIEVENGTVGGRCGDSGRSQPGWPFSPRLPNGLGCPAAIRARMSRLCSRKVGQKRCRLIPKSTKRDVSDPGDVRIERGEARLSAKDPSPLGLNALFVAARADAAKIGNRSPSRIRPGRTPPRAMRSCSRRRGAAAALLSVVFEA